MVPDSKRGLLGLRVCRKPPTRSTPLKIISWLLMSSTVTTARGFVEILRRRAGDRGYAPTRVACDRCRERMGWAEFCPCASPAPTKREGLLKKTRGSITFGNQAALKYRPIPTPKSNCLDRKPPCSISRSLSLTVRGPPDVGTVDLRAEAAFD